LINDNEDQLLDDEVSPVKLQKKCMETPQCWRSSNQP